MIGQVIRGYKILEEIGRGGNGVVYLAEDTRLNRKVALKFLKSHLYQPEKILQEARLASQVHHPGVVTIFDIVESEDGSFIVMEYVEGEPLSRFLKTHRLEMPVALKLAKKLVSVIEAAHRENLIHGDIKPSNIIITPDGNIKLLDFGLAIGLNERGKQNTFSGTIPFSAPEQLTGAHPSKQADIYALGVILYLLFTRKLPFDNLNQAGQIYAITNQPPQPPRQLAPHLPEELNQIILRCLEKQPASRFRTATTLLRDLESIDLDNQLKSGPISKWAWSAIVVFFIFLTAFLGFKIYQQQTTPIKVSNLQEIDLQNNTNIHINLYSSQTLSGEIQTWLYGLKEILQDKLPQINGLKPEISKPTNLHIQEQPTTDNELLCNISFLNNKNQKELRVEYLYGTQKTQKIIPWKSFNEISWITQKIITDILFLVSGKRYLLPEESSLNENKLLAYQYLSNGLFQLNEGLYAEAIENFNAALSYSPFLQQAHFYKGQALMQIKQYQEAISSFIQSLPQADRSPLFDWQIKLSESPNPIWYTDDVRESTTTSSQPSSVFYFSEKEKKNSYLVDIESRKIIKVKYPESFKNFLTLSVYKNGNEFNFLIHFKSKRYFRFITYYPDTDHWEIGEPIVGSYYKVLHPFLYFFDIDGNEVVRYHYKYPAAKTTFPIPFKNSCQLRISNDGKFGIVYNSHELAVINFIEEDLKTISNREFWPSTPFRSPLITGEHMLFSDINDSLLYIFNLRKSKIEHIEQLIDYPTFSRKNTRSHQYFVDTDNGTFGFITKDNVVKIFRSIPDSGLKLLVDYQLEKSEYVFLAPYTHFTSPEEKNNAILLDEENDRMLVFNFEKIEPFEIRFNILPKIKKIYFARNHIFFLTKDKLITYDTNSQKIIWQLEGAFSLNVIQAFPDFVAFFDTKGQRLSIYNLEDRKFYGFYPFSPTKKQIFFSKNYLGYLSGQYLKVANLSSLLERDNLHAINIYEHIIDSHMALGDWEMAYKFADQGLKKYQPQLSTFLISRAKSLYNLHEYLRVFRELPNLYNTFPVNTARRKQVEKFLSDIGLYDWHTNIQLRNGFRLLETSERFLIFCDHTSWRNSVLQIIQKKNGEIEKEIEVGRSFSGFLSKNNILTGFELLPEEDKGRFFRFDLNLGTHQELEFTPDIKNSNPLMLPDYQTPNPLFVLFTGKKNSTEKLYEVDFFRNKIDTVAHFEHAIYATHWKKPVFYFCGKDTLFSLNLINSKLNHQLIFLSKNGYYPLIKILYIDSNKLFGRTSRGNLIKINLNTGQPEVISNSIYFANEFGAFSRSHEVILWGKEGYKRFPYPSPNKMIDFIKKGNDLIALEPYRLLQIRNKKVIAEYPLIWKAIKFKIDGEKAYILSDSGILYSIDLKWNLKINENVKKGLILCLN